MLWMINIFMLFGESDFVEILSFVKNGFYVVSFGGGQVDIMNGKFVFFMNEVYFVENGEIIKFVKGVILIGNGFDVLIWVRVVGNDLRLDEGVGICGKEG